MTTIDYLAPKSNRLVSGRGPRFASKSADTDCTEDDRLSRRERRIQPAHRSAPAPRPPAPLVFSGSCSAPLI